MKKTNRGFGIHEFSDANGVECSLQESSAACDEGLIWLGCNKIGLKRFVPREGWSNVELEHNPPYGILHQANTRMHLTQSQVRALLPALSYFAEHGVLPRRRLQHAEQGRVMLIITTPDGTEVAVAVVPVEPTREMWAAAGTAVIATRARSGNHDDMSEAVHTAMITTTDPSLLGAVIKMRRVLAKIVLDWDGEPEDMADAVAVLARIKETPDA